MTKETHDALCIALEAAYTIIENEAAAGHFRTIPHMKAAATIAETTSKALQLAKEVLAQQELHHA